MPRFILLLALALLLTPLPLSAWSALGHRLIAHLAEQALRPATRARALALLSDEGAVSLADIASWADQVRDTPGFEWSKPLHFVNFQDDCRYDAARFCRNGACVVGGVQRFAAELADPGLPRQRRADALKWLVHLVGDLHQPMHSAFAHDLGGNRHQVNLNDRGSNLHAVWDADILAQRGLPQDQHLALLAALPVPESGPLAPTQWAEQTCALIAAHAIYPATHRIGEDYLNQHLPLAEAQLRLAGVHLTALIEQALGEQALGEQDQ